MATEFNFELVSPERLLVSGSVSEVVIPATEGEMTVMANHAPTMTTIKPGVVTVKTADGKKDRYVVFGGFADIIPTGCTLLAESAVHVDDFNSADITRIAANGTFIDSTSFGPSIGMLRVSLLVDRAKRRQYGLPAELKARPLDDVRAHQRNYVQVDRVNSDITVTTSADQTPIAPGNRVFNGTALLHIDLMERVINEPVKDDNGRT